MTLSRATNPTVQARYPSGTIRPSTGIAIDGCGKLTRLVCPDCHAGARSNQPYTSARMEIAHDD